MFVAALLVAAGMLWLLQAQTPGASSTNPSPSKEPANLDFNGIGEEDALGQPLGEILSKEKLALPVDPTQSGIQVVSGNILPIQQQPSEEEKQQNPNAQPTVGALRIVGEMRNLTSRKVKNVQVLLRLFDENEELVATKVASWNPNFTLPPLDIGETGVYDVIVPGKPPQFNGASVEIRVVEPPKDAPGFVSSAAFKLEDQNLEEKQASGQGRTVEYHQFTATLVNVTQREIVNPGVQVWLKNSDNRIYALASQNFTADLLAPGQELSVEINLIPFSPGELVDYGVRVYGEEF